ncbi:MAG: 1,6-anhydro-N-acetylmuramyl-L-alanine amidase AmpD [Pontibacterium sp.]
MKFTVENGQVIQARQCPSPNFNQRPQETPISLLVVHNISLPPNEFGGGYVHSFFQNQLDPSAHPYFETIAQLQVSAHLFVERTGEVTQFVNLNDRAWHAGRSSFEGLPECNDYSIGIELEGGDDIAYTQVQYQVLSALYEAIAAAYPAITKQRITGHSDIAPGRKTDPGPAFDWQHFLSMCKSL